MGTGTTSTSPATQLTPQQSSPEPDILLPQSTSPLETDPLNLPKNPAWFNLFDQIVPPVSSDMPDMFMGMNNAFMTTQKMLDSVNMFSGSMMASAGLDGGWGNGMPGGLGMAMPLMMPTNTADVGLSMPEQSDEIEFINRADQFQTTQCDDLEMLLRGKWGSRPQAYPSSTLTSTLSPPYATASTDNEPDEDVGATILGSGRVQPTDATVSSVLKSRQQMQAAAQQRAPQLHGTMNDISTVFVEFYFKVTAQVYSCYDSRMNPFRTAVTKTWSSSRVIYCTLQSMAAASLVRDFPEVAPIGRQLRQEAADLLSKTKNWDNNSMLAILMLGGTSSWHNPKDLGLPFFNQIAHCLTAAPTTIFGKDGDRSYRFFRESMLYWEMLLAFVADNDTISTVPDERYDRSSKRPMGPEEVRIPHPWTGFCAETQLVVLKVGRLVRRQRKFGYSHRFASMAAISQLEADMATARALEERLITIRHPTESSVKDTEDRNTPVWHLLTLAEIIRDTGLVQLYHVFPDLLTARLKRERAAAKSNDYSHIGASFGDDMTSSGEPPITQADRSKWLTSFTLKCLDMMKLLPVESGTRDFQPFLLVTLCSGLRINKQRRAGAARSAGGSSAAGMGSNLPLHTLLNLDMETVEVTRARGFMQSRLTAFLHALPPKPILRCLDIVKETWSQMDKQVEFRVQNGVSWMGAEDEADVYWMDVMIQNGWETIMA